MKTIFSILLLCSFALSFGQTFDNSFKDVDVVYVDNSVWVRFDSPVEFDFISQSEDINIVVFGYLMDETDSLSVNIQATRFSTLTTFEDVPENVIWIRSYSKYFSLSSKTEDIAIK
jgi:hypothetical protein